MRRCWHSERFATFACFAKKLRLSVSSVCHLQTIFFCRWIVAILFEKFTSYICLKCLTAYFQAKKKLYCTSGINWEFSTTYKESSHRGNRRGHSPAPLWCSRTSWNIHLPHHHRTSSGCCTPSTPPTSIPLRLWNLEKRPRKCFSCIFRCKVEWSPTERDTPEPCFCMSKVPFDINRLPHSFLSSVSAVFPCKTVPRSHYSSWISPLRSVDNKSQSEALTRTWVTDIAKRYIANWNYTEQWPF